MTNEEKRIADLRRVRGAAQTLADNRDWNIIWLHLQKKFPLASPSFEVGHEEKTHRAAKKDGNREVMAELLTLMSLPADVDFELGNVELKPGATNTDTPKP